MLDREQRALLVVPYSPPPPPRRHMVVATAFLFLGSVAALGLAMADYSAATTASLIVAATVALVNRGRVVHPGTTGPPPIPARDGTGD